MIRRSFTTCCWDSVPVPVIAVDREMNVLYANKAAATLTGIPQEQCMKNKCSALMHTSDCSTENCAASRAMLQERTQKRRDSCKTALR